MTILMHRPMMRSLNRCCIYFQNFVDDPSSHSSTLVSNIYLAMWIRFNTMRIQYKTHLPKTKITQYALEDSPEHIGTPGLVFCSVVNSSSTKKSTSIFSARVKRCVRRFTKIESADLNLSFLSSQKKEVMASCHLAWSRIISLVNNADIMHFPQPGPPDI
jgi:hypothetical protein